MAFSLGAAHAPSLGDWFNPGLTPRVVDQDRAPYPILHARNVSTKLDSVNMFVDSLYDDVEYAASIVTACADRTVYALQCTSAPASVGLGSNCGPNGIVSFNSLPISASLNKY